MKRFVAPFAIAAMLCLPACQTSKDSMSDSSAMAVNTTCPMSGEPIDMDHTVMFEGKTIAFCCPKCEAKFEQMSQEEKEATLAKAMGH